MPLALIGSVTDLAELQGGVGAKIDHVKQATRCPGVTLRETRVFVIYRGSSSLCCRNGATTRPETPPHRGPPTPPGWTVAIGAEPMLPLDPSELYADWKRPTQIEEDPIFGVPRANPARVMSSIIRARRGDMEVSFR